LNIVFGKVSGYSGKIFPDNDVGGCKVGGSFCLVYGLIGKLECLFLVFVGGVFFGKICFSYGQICLRKIEPEIGIARIELDCLQLEGVGLDGIGFDVFDCLKNGEV